MAQKKIFLICGDEEYLKEQKKNELLKTFRCEGSLNYNVFSDDNMDLAEISALAGTVPFMEDQRVIFISESGFFRGNVSETTAEVFKDLPDTTIVIFYEGNADRSNTLYKYVDKNGEIFRFDAVENKVSREKNAGKTDIRNWVRDELKRADRKIDSKVLYSLVEMTGYDMQNLSTEIEKLICYTLDRPKGYVITAEDVDQICSKTLSDKVFEMVDCKFRGNVKRALEILEELYAMKVQPMRILYVIVRQYNQAYAYKECRQRRMSDAETASELNVKDWLIDRLRTQTESITAEELRARLEDCAETEYKVKQGDLPDKLAIELLLVK